MDNSMSNHYKAPIGYRYEKDGITTDELWLGINDSISNWRLITEGEALKIEEKQDLETIRNILLADREEAVID